MIFTQGHLGKFTVFERKKSYFVSALKHSYGETWEDPISHKDLDFKWPNNVSWTWQRVSFASLQVRCLRNA